MGRPGTVKEFMQGSALHEAKQALLSTAQAEGLAAYHARMAAATVDRPLPADQRLNLITGAVIDTLILKLEPRR